MSQDTSSVNRQAFMDRLREQWEKQPTEQYEFVGLTGMDYNDWLEHRHGWPVDAAGNCRIHSELEEFPATDCKVCSILIKLYEEQHGSTTELAPNSFVTTDDAAHLAATSARPMRVGRLSASFLADHAALEQATAYWSLEQLTAAASSLTAASIRRRESMFVDVLRALFYIPPSAGEPVARVEFVTDSPAENGVFWNESRVYLHHTDGSVDEFEDFTEDGDEKELYADLDDMFRDLLTDIAADTPPQPGDHLIVDLTTGEFERSGKWAA